MIIVEIIRRERNKAGLTQEKLAKAAGRSRRRGRRMTVGETIKQERKRAKMSQLQLAEKLGVPFQSVSQWERGKRNPKITTLIKIADAIGIPASEFVLSAMDCGANKESGR